MTEPPNDPEGWDALGAAWRSDAGGDARIGGSAFDAVDVGAVRASADAFARRIRRRNAIELGAAVFVTAAGAQMAWTSERPLMIAGGVAMALGAILVSVVLVLRGRNVAPPPFDAPTSVVLMHARGELDRQARLVERVWLWYLAPLLPSLVLIHADEILRAIEGGDRAKIAQAVGLSVVSVGVFVLVERLNQRSARRLRARARVLIGADETDEPSTRSPRRRGDPP